MIRSIEARVVKKNASRFNIGDTVNVHCKILEGDKERIQIFNGVVIARSGGGSREMFTVRRIVAGEGVERKFPVHSPRIAKIEVVRSAVVRRAKLYFLRDRVGKAVRLAERRVERVVDETAKSTKMKRGKKAKAARKNQQKAE
ncbi:MAG: 50S ribosomal protein L19 [Thermoguttaceae bacterium]|nr:50S ribosomal protein L19 [Thermoguttaceae bacterium]